MPIKTWLLISGLVIVTVILVVIASNESRRPKSQINCADYSNYVIKDIPARCVKYFEGR